MKCSIAWLYWFIGITIFCIDRITKNAALDLFYEKTNSAFSGLSYQTIINRGFSWGMLHSSNELVFVLVSLVIAVVTGAVCWLAYTSYQRGEPIFGYVCIIAGSVANLVDRICYHGVIDFIVVSVYGYSWPVFNVADMAIVIGVMIVMFSDYASLRFQKTSKASSDKPNYKK